jgi:predicted porin
LGAEYALRENLAAKLSCDLADSEDSICLELSGNYALTEPWALTGGVAYTDYSKKDSVDYHELELSVGAEYQFNKALLASLSYVYTDTSEAGADNDSKAVLGAEYSFDKYGIYCEYELPDKANDKVILGVAYHF